MRHITVLKDESVNALNLSEGSVVVDCTLGAGGHGWEIVSQLGTAGHYIGLDADPTAVKAAEAKFATATPHTTLLTRNFTELTTTLSELNIDTVDAILADLGWRMEQFDGSSGLPRGFSFQSDEPLLMTYGDPSSYAFTAADIVNEWAEEDIANIIYAYGEERAARKIADRIVTTRKVTPITTASQLAELVAAVVKTSPRSKTHPATRTFQALRIAVNDEFAVLESLLSQGMTALRSGGRLAVISFHSLEDRIVKHTFRTFAHDHQATVVTKKPIVATEEELSTNPRARSAKLRVIEKI